MSRFPRLRPRSALPCTVLMAAALAAPSLRAQTVPAVAGAAVGALAGGLVSTAVITANARRGHYLYAPEQARWELLPVPVLAMGAAVVGARDGGRLWRATGWGGAGMVVGAALGAWAGHTAWDDPGGVWAGGVMGGAVGLLAGALIGAASYDGTDAAPLTLTLGTVGVPW
ncbi:MAG: hypothetical protein RJQ04_19090 [Longimicrobiales bacterium]